MLRKLEAKVLMYAKFTHRVVCICNFGISVLMAERVVGSHLNPHLDGWIGIHLLYFSVNPLGYTLLRVPCVALELQTSNLDAHFVIQYG